jgi:LysR family hydrogen peroxide-inducible transcriptional activator
MVAAGDGVTLLPELAVQPPVAPSDDIRLLRFSEPVPRRQLAMCWRRTNVYADFFPKLAEVVRDLPAGLVGKP